MCVLLVRSPSAALGVGHPEEEESLPLVRRPDLRRREEAFLDAVAKALKVRAEAAVILPKAASHILEEAPADSGFANNSDALGPEVAVVGCPSLLPGGAVGLAREAGHDSLHAAAPRSSVEGSEVRPERRVRKCAVRNTRCQDAGRSDFDLHVADWDSRSASESDADIESASAAGK